MARGKTTSERNDAPHLSCPFCTSYEIGRMYVASSRVDSCECMVCGARWDEEEGSGAYRGRSKRSSALLHDD